MDGKRAAPQAVEWTRQVERLELAGPQRLPGLMTLSYTDQHGVAWSPSASRLQHMELTLFWSSGSGADAGERRTTRHTASAQDGIENLARLTCGDADADSGLWSVCHFRTLASRPS